MVKILNIFLMWILAGTFYFYEYLIQIMPNVLAPHLLQFFHIDSLALGSLGSAYFLTYVLIQVPSGILLDKLGVRYSLLMAALACSLGLLLFGITHSFTIAIAARALTGLGGGFAFIAGMKIAADWLPSKLFPLLAALTLAIGTLGASFGNYLIAKLQLVFSWQEITLLFAFIGLFIFLLMLFTLFDPSHQKIELRHRFKAFWQDLKVSKQEILQIAQKKNNWFASLYMTFFYAPVSALGAMWGHLFSITKFHSADNANISALLFLGMTLGGPIIGILSQFFFSFYQILFMGGILSLITMLLTLYWAPNILIAQWIMLFYGILVSSFAPVYVIMGKQNIPSLQATAIAFLNMMAMVLGGIIFQPLIGYLLELFASQRAHYVFQVYELIDYEKSLAILPCSILLSLIFLLLLWLYKK